MLYLKKLARLILKDEIKEITQNHNKVVKEFNKLNKKIKRLEDPESILLSYYRVDNIGADGMPPSYLDSRDKNEYSKSINELDSVYRNTSFRNLLAWALNFHANMSLSGRIRNEFGDYIDIPTEHARHMISGIKAVWELVVAAHNKNKELIENKNFDPFTLEDN